MSLESLIEGLGAALLIGLALAGMGSAIALFIGVRSLQRRWQDWKRDFSLRAQPDGQKAARLAREIRAGANRLRKGLLPAHQDRREAQELQKMLARFIERELPESLDRIISLVALGGGQKEKTLVRRLERQQNTWSSTSEGQPQQTLAREMAVTRQLLDQTRQANRSLVRVTAGLAETARALRTLEVELAALGAVRASERDLSAHMAETAEDLRHFREAYLSLEAPADRGRP